MTTATEQLKQLMDFAVDIAREAGAITWRHYQGLFVAERKADNSFVTIADREAEAYLRTRIAEAFPDDSILGEEEGEQSGSSNRRWILDPIDGTYSLRIYREAVTSQSPGLLQPWGKYVPIIVNPERVATAGATALRLNRRLIV